MQNSNFKVQTSKKSQISKIQNTFDLEDRLGKFGGDVIALCKLIKQDFITSPLINQIVRSATSIGANYCEANNASSRKDFINKISIAKKEAQETKHWLRMLSVATPEKTEELRQLWQENHEIVLILQTITTKAKAKKDD